MMAFFNGKKKSKWLMVAILVVTLVASYAVPMTVFATGTDGEGNPQVVQNDGDQGGDTGTGDTGTGDTGTGDTGTGDTGTGDTGTGDTGTGDTGTGDTGTGDTGTGDTGTGDTGTGDTGTGDTGTGDTGDGITDGKELVDEQPGLMLLTMSEKPDYGISLEKTANKTKASPGDVIIYTFKVKNTGKNDLSNVIIKDPMFGNDWSATYSFVKSGKSKSTTMTYTVPADTHVNSSLVNNATVTGDNGVSGDGREEVSATAMATVSIVPPYQIMIEKTANIAKASPGDEVVYTFTVTNTGTKDLKNVKITDSKVGFTHTFKTDLPANNTKSTKYEYTLPNNTPMGEFTNEATATGMDKNENGSIVATDTDTAVVTVVPAYGITLEKTVSPDTASPGDELTYKFKVTNTGTKTLYSVKVTDTKVDDTWLYAFSLGPGSSKEFETDYDIPWNTPEHSILTNTATVSGKDGRGNVVATATDTADVTVIPKYEIQLEKTASAATANPGDEITYTFIIKNTGSRDLEDVVLIDSKLGSGWKIELDELEAGATKTYDEELTVPADTPVNTDFINTASVKADYTEHHHYWGIIYIGHGHWCETKHVSDDASATVRIVEKIVPPEEPTPAETVKFFVRTVGPRPTVQGSQDSANFTSVLETIYITDPAISLDPGNSHVNEFSEDSADSVVENEVKDWADLDSSSYESLIDSIMAELQSGAYDGFLSQFDDENWHIDWYDLKWENDAWHVDGDIAIDEEPPVEPEEISYTVNFLATSSGITVSGIMSNNTTQSSVSITLPVITGYQLASVQPVYPIYGGENEIVGYQTHIENGVLTILLAQDIDGERSYYEFRDFDVWYTEITETDNGGDNNKNRRGGGGGGTAIIPDEPIPAAPVDDQTLMDEAVPAGPLPQTGGVPSILLYGLGAILAGGGTALKFRNKKRQNEVK